MRAVKWDGGGEIDLVMCLSTDSNSNPWQNSAYTNRNTPQCVCSHSYKPQRKKKQRGRRARHAREDHGEKKGKVEIRKKRGGGAVPSPQSAPRVRCPWTLGRGHRAFGMGWKKRVSLRTATGEN